MSKEAFLLRLEELVGELNAMRSTDPASLEALRQVSADLRTLLEQEKDAKPATLVAVARDRIEQLECEHPVVARFLAELTDSLALLGI